MKKSLFDLRLLELKDELIEKGHQSFRAQQILDWLYKKNILEISAMTNLPDALRTELEASYTTTIPVIKHVAHCKSDNSYKFLLESIDVTNETNSDKPRLIESIIMLEQDRVTLCVSCMIGCPLKCKFCATGSEIGFVKNLSCAEILGQFFATQNYIQQHKIAPKITNIVFMGMGEPFLNKDNVAHSVDVLISDWGLGLSKSRITVSTAGVDANIANFINNTGVKLAVSLHFPTDEQRSLYMPANTKFNLDKLVAELKKIEHTRRDYITIEYMMLDGINDTIAHAQKLVRLLSFVKVKFNLIPYNQIQSFSAQSSKPEQIEAFVQYLKSKHFMVTVRRSKGTECSGGCGQFALKQ